MMDLQGFLAGEGFLLAKDSCRSPVNECDWYAYRKMRPRWSRAVPISSISY